MTTTGWRRFSGEGVGARVGRSMFWTVTGFGTSQALRLASNLVLTRLLFPEAFGLMALVTVLLGGLMMFSDIGISPAIQQNPRGDDPAFLDTAWTIQVARGVLLWGAACLLAWPVAAFYDAPGLLQLLPVAGLSLVVAGFTPTRFETASRHLQIGRATMVGIGAQVVGLGLTIALAWAMGSVWALAIGMVLSETVRQIMLHGLLPGHVNRLSYEREAASELIAFGKWIFLSTICGFLVVQGDRLILGRYLSLDMLGIYSIGFFLASFPIMLGSTAMERLMIPIYRMRPPQQSEDNFRAIRRMRMALSGGLMLLVAVLALGGPILVTLLYDPRYQAAGGIVVLISCVVMLQIIALTYDRAALAAGDARGFFWLLAWRSGLQTLFFIAGAELGGLVGALVGQALSVFAIYPLQLRIARRHGAWDGWHDLLFGGLALALAATALWINQDALGALFNDVAQTERMMPS